MSLTLKLSSPKLASTFLFSWIFLRICNSYSLGPYISHIELTCVRIRELATLLSGLSCSSFENNLGYESGSVDQSGYDSPPTVHRFICRLASWSANLSSTHAQHRSFRHRWVGRHIVELYRISLGEIAVILHASHPFPEVHDQKCRKQNKCSSLNHLQNCDFAVNFSIFCHCTERSLSENQLVWG